MGNVIVSTLVKDVGGGPFGICRNGKSEIFYSVMETGPIRKFYLDGTMNNFYTIPELGGQDCVVDPLNNVYIGIILITV
jgi:hypothetical protein